MRIIYHTCCTYDSVHIHPPTPWAVFARQNHWPSSWYIEQGTSSGLFQDYCFREFFLDVFQRRFVAHLKHICRLGLTWKGHSFYPFRTGHSNLERHVVEILKARSLQASSRTADLFWLVIYNLYLYLYFSIRHKIKSTKKLAGCAVLGQLLRF